MTIQEILKEANYPTQSDNRSRTIRQINKLLTETDITITVVSKGFMRTTKKGFDWTIKITGFGKVTRFYTKQNYIEPINILTSIGKFLKREDIQEIVKADVRFPYKCGKCEATGNLPQFAYYANGVCFDCMGSGYVSLETSVEINKKLTPAQLIKKYHLFIDQVKFQGLKKINCLKNKEHETAEHWLFERGKFFYIGQPKCQDKTSFKIPKIEFIEFINNYNKSHFVRIMGTLKT